MLQLVRASVNTAIYGVMIEDSPHVHAFLSLQVEKSEQDGTWYLAEQPLRGSYNPIPDILPTACKKQN